MRTDPSSIQAFAPEHSFVCDSDLIGFHNPGEIAADPVLSLSRKWQLLTYWASEIHAVPGAPDLRRFPFGTPVTTDAIETAIAKVDATARGVAQPLPRN